MTEEDALAYVKERLAEFPEYTGFPRSWYEILPDAPATSFYVELAMRLEKEESERWVAEGERDAWLKDTVRQILEKGK